MNVRQIDVEQHEVGLFGRTKAEGLLAGGRVDDVEPMLAQGPAERISQRRIVIDDEDQGCARTHQPSRRLLRGSRNVFKNSASP